MKQPAILGLAHTLKDLKALQICSAILQRKKLLEDKEKLGWEWLNLGRLTHKIVH